METLAFASQLMTILYNEVPSAYSLLYSPALYLLSALLQPLKTQPGENKQNKESEKI